MQLSITTTTVGGEDRSWTKHKKGWDTCRSITLDLSQFVLATHYANGILPSGLVLGKVTATGRYGAYADAGAGGLDTAVGHLFTSLYVGTATTGLVVGTLFWEGIVDTTRLPSNSGITTASRADVVNQIRYEGAGA
jgi:hypothetical protein